MNIFSMKDAVNCFIMLHDIVEEMLLSFYHHAKFLGIGILLRKK
jgi:hypothetical protein